MKKKIIFTILSILLLGVAWWLISPLFIIKEVYEPSPENNLAINSKLILSGELQPKAHEVAGKVLILEQDNKKILRFENFETINGPDLRIYLSTDLSAKDYVDLGEIKATKGNVNYEIDDSIDLEKYNKVLIWCRAFSVLFSYADLN